MHVPCRWARVAMAFGAAVIGKYVGAGGGALYATPAGTNPNFFTGVQVTYTQ